jgi:hypothetical protein
MLIITRLFSHKASEISLRRGIQETKESLLRLEILTNELNDAEENVRSHEKLLKIAFEEIEMPAWSKDLDGRFVCMNLACAERILHTTIENGLALTDKDFKADALSEVCMASDRIVLSTRKTHRQIEYAKYANGKFVVLDTTKSPWIVDGELVGTVGFGRVITDIIHESVKNILKNSGYILIPLDLMYNPEDINKLMSQTETDKR